jgi:predicted GIY-YIG superfamily endonuclease
MMAIGPGETGLSYNQQGIATAPHASGVYVLYTAQKWVYVGESYDIQRRLVEHVTTTDTYITRQHPTGFMFELVVGDGARRARQNQLIVALNPVCNQIMG